MPAPTEATFDEVCVIGTDEGEPLRSADLARGPRQLIVLGDADAVDIARLGAHVRRIRLEVEPGAHPIARQVG